MQGSAFLFGSYHHHYSADALALLLTTGYRTVPTNSADAGLDAVDAWPFVPDNNILALSTCHTLRTEIDFGDPSVVQAFDECSVLPGNAFSHIHGWPVHTSNGESLLDRVDTDTADKLRAYMTAVIDRFRYENCTHSSGLVPVPDSMEN